MNRLRAPINIAIAVLLVIGTIASQTAVARSDDMGGASVLAKYDGETIFSAIFFAKGPGAAALPARGFAPPTDDEARAIVDAIGTADPGFFTRFAADIHSGDRALIRDAVNGAARHLHDAVASRYHSLGCDPTIDPTCTPCDPTIDPTCTPCDPTLDPTCSSVDGLKLLIAVNAIIAIVATVAADFVRVVDIYRDYNIYVSSDVYRTQYWTQAVLGDNDSALTADAFIDAIAKAFGA
jgi:hypothetical protein